MFLRGVAVADKRLQAAAIDGAEGDGLGGRIDHARAPGEDFTRECARMKSGRPTQKSE
jgi:hypothetical protein